MRVNRRVNKISMDLQFYMFDTQYTIIIAMINEHE